MVKEKVNAVSGLTQTKFARLVGRTQQTISEAVRAGTLAVESDGKISADHPLNKRYMESARLRDLQGLSGERFKPFPTLRARQIAQLVENIVRDMTASPEKEAGEIAAALGLQGRENVIAQILRSDTEKLLADLRRLAAEMIGTPSRFGVREAQG